jgi:(1->4)-alpha-D-glucan 1-alpha-D-glucosylmutase
VPLTTEVTVPADIVAFARIAGDDAAIVVVPRLTTGMVTADAPLPLGGDRWKTSRVMLPEALAERTFRNIFTGEEIRPTAAPDSAWLFVGQIFDKLPVGILRAT